MPSFRFHKTDSPTTAVCFGSFFNLLDSTNVEVLYDSNTKANPIKKEDGHVCRFPLDVVKRHVSYLRRCGFVFEFNIYDPPKIDVAGVQLGGGIRLAASENLSGAYGMYLKSGTNHPLMAKFCLTAWRWIHQFSNCMHAFHQMVEEIAPKTECETFNLLTIAVMADKGFLSDHNVRLINRIVIPMSEAEFAKFKEYGNLGMSTTLKTVTDVAGVLPRRDKDGLPGYVADFTWLTEPGGYERYMKTLEQVQKYSTVGGQSDLLKDALGLAPVGEAVL